MASLRMPGEVVLGRSPSFVASTQAAVAGYAEANGAGVAVRARRTLFRAYWVSGLDIGNPEVLLGDIIVELGSPREPVLVDGAGPTATGDGVLAERERRLLGRPAHLVVFGGGCVGENRGDGPVSWTASAPGSN